MFLLSYKRIKRLKAILWCGVVACKDNDKSDDCGSGGVVCRVVWCGVDSLKGWLVGLWIKWCGVGMRKPVRELYPMRNPDFVIAF